MIPDIRAHYLLFTEASTGGPHDGSWRFSLEQVGGGRTLAATDVEPAANVERLELLAVVRGLEALDELASVTLVTRSRYVSRGLKLGLADWRTNDWHWERFGQIVPVRDHDLWRRIDRAMAYHRLDCRLWRFGERRRDAAPLGRAVAESAGARLAAAARSRIRQISRAAASWGPPIHSAGLAAG